ncbi:MAG: polysaccharide deacetylase family protein [Peptostreptococcaceae bacterium]
MRKKLRVALGLVFVAVMFYSLKNNNFKSKEALNVNQENDITMDYEDIIIKKGNTEEKVVALTFDDGPDEDFTPQILDILKKHEVKATFFVIGEKVEYHPEIVKRELAEGHEIGNHTYTHINVSKRGYDDINNEISKTQEAIKKVTGEEPKIFRPPYRAISKNMCDIVKNKNMNIVLWSSLDPRDWSNPGVYYIVNTIDTKVENGNIILLHDYNNLRNSKSQTIQALDSVITNLKSKGYKFVTVSEMIEHLDKKEQQTQN